MGLSPAAILYDSSGNAISSSLDGSTRRLAVAASLKPGTSIDIGGPSPSDLTTLVRARLEDSGSSTDLRVDGSSTPVAFTYNAHATKETFLYELRFVMAASTIKIDGNSFGPIPTLSNGLKFEVRSSDTTTELMLATVTEEFLALSNPNIFLDRTGATDVLAFSYTFGGAAILHDGSGDFVKVTIQDDLTSTQFKFFEATLSAVEV
jgi:hypothetical protein